MAPPVCPQPRHQFGDRIISAIPATAGASPSRSRPPTPPLGTANLSLTVNPVAPQHGPDRLRDREPGDDGLIRPPARSLPRGRRAERGRQSHVSATSSNQTLVPGANLSVGGRRESHADRHARRRPDRHDHGHRDRERRHPRPTSAFTLTVNPLVPATAWSQPTNFNERRRHDAHRLLRQRHHGAINGATWTTRQVQRRPHVNGSSDLSSSTPRPR